MERIAKMGHGCITPQNLHNISGESFGKIYEVSWEVNMHYHMIPDGKTTTRITSNGRGIDSQAIKQTSNKQGNVYNSISKQLDWMVLELY